MSTHSSRSAGRSSASKQSTGRHRATGTSRTQAYAWLGAGAFTFGIGAALVTGAGVATADSGSDPASSSSAAGPSSADSGAGSDAASSAGGADSVKTPSKPTRGKANSGEVAQRPSAGRAAKADTDTDADSAAAAAHDADSARDDDSASVRAVVSVTPPPTEEVSDPPPAEEPVLLGVIGLPVAAAPNSRSAAVPNTAPTVTVRSVGSPGMFSAAVRGRIRATDADRDRLTFTGSTTALGTVTVNRLGSFTYTPTKAAQHAAAAADGRRTDSVGITVDDGFGGVVTTYVTVTIKPANARPTGKATVGQANPATGAVTGRVTGTDRDGDALGFTGSAATPRGNVVVYGDGTFVYTPTAEALAGATSLFSRSDRFTVTVTDGHGGTSAVTVSVKIPKPGTNQSPQLGSPQFVVTGIDGNTGQVTGHINATDPEGFGLTYRVNTVVDPGVGSVAVNSAGHFSFVPTVAAREAAYHSPGEDTAQFSAVVTDGAATTVVVITVPISAKAPAPPPAPTLSARVEAFVSATRGRTIAAPDGSYPGECVSLIKRFLRDVHGISAGAWGNAVDYRQGGVGGNQMAARGFVWRTDGNFQNGDILVWGSGAGTSYGHIGIWNAGKLYDQNNYGSGRASAPRTANYSPYVPPGRLGYWRKA